TTAGNAWRESNISLLDEVLQEMRPGPRDEDLRGFEWYYLWRARHSNQFTFRGHKAIVRCLAYNADGTRLASCSWDGTAKVWDVLTGKEVLNLQLGAP